MYSTPPHLLAVWFFAGLIFPVLCVVATWLKANNFQFTPGRGSMRKDVEPDLVIWSGSLIPSAGTLLETRQKSKEDASKVEQFLRRQMTIFNFAPIRSQPGRRSFVLK